MKLDTYFYFSTFDLEVNATEILKYILPFSCLILKVIVCFHKIDSSSLILQDYGRSKGQITKY